MFLILLLVSFFGAGSIGIVWLRMDISRVAKKCGQLETDREVVSRELYELRGQKSRSLTVYSSGYDFGVWRCRT